MIIATIFLEQCKTCAYRDHWKNCENKQSTEYLRTVDDTDSCMEYVSDSIEEV